MVAKRFAVAGIDLVDGQRRQPLQRVDHLWQGRWARLARRRRLDHRCGRWDHQRIGGEQLAAIRLVKGGEMAVMPREVEHLPGQSTEHQGTVDREGMDSFAGERLPGSQRALHPVEH